MYENYWIRKQADTPLSRRRVLRGGTVLGAGAASAWLVGCGGGDSSKTPTASGGTTPTAAVANQDVDLNATLTVGFPAFPPTLDPTTAGGLGSQAANAGYHFDSLFARSKGGQTVSDGWATYKYINNNATLRIAANPGGLFHNGEPLDAECIKFYFDRILGRASYNPGFISGQKARINSWMGDIAIVDPLTVDIALKAPYVFAHENTGGRTFPFTPRKYILDNGDAYFAQHPIGMGPMIFESFTPDQELKNVRNDKYPFPRNYQYGNRLPWVARMVGRSIPEEQARMAAVEKGEIDIAFGVTPDSAKPFVNRKGFQVLYYPSELVNELELPINASTDPKTGKPNPWRDIRVRQALNYAIDIDKIIKTLLTGSERRIFSSFPSGNPPPLGTMAKPYSFDPVKARALLKEAGQEGFAFDITNAGPATADVWGPAVAQMLNDVGFKVSMVYQDLGNLLTAVNARKVPGPYIFNQGSIDKGRGDPGFSWGIIGTTGAAYAHASKTDDLLPEQVAFDRLIAQANAEFDEKKRNDLYYQAAVIHYQNAFAGFLFNRTAIYVTSSKIVYEEYSDLPNIMSLTWVKKLRA